MKAFDLYFKQFELFEYLINFYLQRTPIFLDTIFKSSMNHVLLKNQNQPAVLVFDYELVFSGQNLDPPVNYDLVRIIDRRSDEGHDARHLPTKENRDYSSYDELKNQIGNKSKRPLFVVDPRAGHGPGISGSKTNSQIGIALEIGMPVYLALFHPQTKPDQKVEDIERALQYYLMLISKDHPDQEKPCVVANCQAGWSIAMALADKPGISGPAVLNGSPLSPSSGDINSSSMRLKPAILGGQWLASYLSDLNQNLFDPANLVFQFEILNWSNTFWGKHYKLFANADTESDRYINFDKWWSALYQLSGKEISWIIEKHFLKDDLSNDKLRIGGKAVSIKNIKSPIIVFCSEGDDITPPAQALGWILRLYESEEEIVAKEQTIVYMIHPKIGHLGIFVSSNTCSREHRELIASFELFDNLKPGLYKLCMDDDYSDMSKAVTDEAGEHLYSMSIKPCGFQELSRDCGAIDEKFEKKWQNYVELSSLLNDSYIKYASPFVRAIAGSQLPQLIPSLHPFRVKNTTPLLLAPFQIPIAYMADIAKKYYIDIEDNPCFQLEKRLAKQIGEKIDSTRLSHDKFVKKMFEAIY